MDYIEFTVPENTYFVIPKAEALEEPYVVKKAVLMLT
jgi:hypothetical protein